MPLPFLFVAFSIFTAAARAADTPWIKAATEHFTILTPAGEGVARKWAAELEQFRRGLQASIPVHVERLRPVTVVLFKDEREMEPFAPLEKGQPAKIGGLFVRANDVNTIMLSLDRNAGDTRQVIFHEAVHWHMSAREGVMPLWLGEGLAELYATFEAPGGKTYSFGAARNDYVRQLRGGNLLPLSQLVGIGRDSLLYNEGTRASIFYAQSWAFVHYLFHGDKSPGRGAVLRYLALLHEGEAPDDAFARAFGGNYAALEAQLVRYINEGLYQKHTYRRTTRDLARSVVVQPATEADLTLAKGSLLLVSRGARAAEPHLRRATELAPRDPRPWELLGHIAVARKNFPAAAAALTKAAAAGSTSYLVYHNLAVTRLPDTVAADLPDPGFDPVAMDAAAADYRHAIRLAPAHLASYEGLAGLVNGMATFEPADLDLLIRGLLQDPGNPMIDVGIAAGELRAGRTAAGRARLARIVARHAESAHRGVAFARQLLAAETLRAEIDEINALGKQNRLDEIIAIADRALTRPLDATQRRSMLEVRRRAADFKMINAAVEQANTGDVPAAKRAIEALLAAEPEAEVAAEASRLLAELAKHEAARPHR